MSELQTAQVIQAFFGFFAITGLWFWGWRRWAIDALRQDLFAARDRLFDIAAENAGGFSFTHPHYGALRSHFHASIRFAHRMNMMQLLVVRVIQSRFAPIETPMVHERTNFLAGVECETQAKILGVINLWHLAVVKFLARTSPLFHIMLVYWFAKAVIKVMTTRFKMQPGFPSESSRVSAAMWTEVALAEDLEESEAGVLIPH
jgi:hypothetical protein